MKNNNKNIISPVALNGNSAAQDTEEELTVSYSYQKGNFNFDTELIKQQALAFCQQKQAREKAKKEYLSNIINNTVTPVNIIHK